MKAKNKLMERMKRVKLIYDWLAFIVDVFVGYRPEASLRSQTNSAISSPSMALLFVFALIEFAPAKTGQPH